MLKKHMAACLFATALMTPALAQSTTSVPSTDRPTASGSGSTTSGSPAMVPGGAPSSAPGSSGAGGMSSTSGAAPASGAPTTSSSGSPSTGSSAGSSTTSSGPGASTANTARSGGTAAQGNFVPQLQSGEWRASKLIGARVVSANNESIGDVNDVVLDRNGTAQAVVIGVGGFLGIGEKSVALPFRSLELGSSRDAATTASTSSSGTAATSASSGDVDRIILRLTKADLEAAPAFQTGPSSETGSGRTSGAGGNTPPRQ